MAGRKHVDIEWFGDDLQRAVQRAGEPALWAAGQELKREAVRRAPSATGRLRDSAYVATAVRSDYRKGARDRRKVAVPADSDTVVVGFGVWYSRLLENSGAEPHVIPRVSKKRPRPQKVLKIGGRFYSRVNHRGMKRRSFLAAALEDKKNELGQRVAEVMKRAIDG